MSSFERCWSSLLRLLMSLRKSLLRIDEAYLLETFGSLKIRNFEYTLSCLQLLRKSMSNFSLFFLYSSFFIFSKIFNCNISIFLCNIVVDVYIFFDSTRLKIVWIKITTFFKRRVSIIL